MQNSAGMFAQAVLDILSNEGLNMRLRSRCRIAAEKHTCEAIVQRLTGASNPRSILTVASTSHDDPARGR